MISFLKFTNESLKERHLMDKIPPQTPSGITRAWKSQYAMLAS